MTRFKCIVRLYSLYVFLYKSSLCDFRTTLPDLIWVMSWSRVIGVSCSCVIVTSFAAAALGSGDCTLFDSLALSTGFRYGVTGRAGICFVLGITALVLLPKSLLQLCHNCFSCSFWKIVYFKELTEVVVGDQIVPTLDHEDICFSHRWPGISCWSSVSGLCL